MSSIASVSVDQAGGTTADIIAAVTGYRIQVLGFCLSVVGAVATVKSTFQDKTANTVRMTLVGTEATPVVYAFAGKRENPAWTGAVSEALELVTGTAAAISGFVIYRLVK
jgi:hypothetical protein